MRHRLPTAARATFATLVATLLLAGTAVAGGWANAILDSPPDDPPTAGEPITIGFTLLQHGQTPVNDGPPTVTVRNAATGEEIAVTARRQGANGHWVAEITFPSEGTWRYEVTHDLIVGMKGFDPVTVRPAAAAAPATTSAATAPPLSWLGLAIVLVVAAAAAWTLARRARAAAPTVRA